MMENDSQLLLRVDPPSNDRTRPIGRDQSFAVGAPSDECYGRLVTSISLDSHALAFLVVVHIYLAILPSNCKDYYSSLYVELKS